MNGNSVALDTNQAIAILNDTRDAGAWISTFETVSLPTPVVGELIFGAMGSRRRDENLARVGTLVDRCRALPITLATARI